MASRHHACRQVAQVRFLLLRKASRDQASEFVQQPLGAAVQRDEVVNEAGYRRVIACKAEHAEGQRSHANAGERPRRNIWRNLRSKLPIKLRDFLAMKKRPLTESTQDLKEVCTIIPRIDHDTQDNVDWDAVFVSKCFGFELSEDHSAPTFVEKSASYPPRNEGNGGSVVHRLIGPSDLSCDTQLELSHPSVLGACQGVEFEGLKDALPILRPVFTQVLQPLCGYPQLAQSIKTIIRIVLNIPSEYRFHFGDFELGHLMDSC